VPGYRIVRDGRGSLVHVRTNEGECIGCIEAGLYEAVRLILREEIAASAREGIPAQAAAAGIVSQEGQE
jgi:hypothetical protein